MHQSGSDSYILIIKDEPYEVIIKEEQGLVNKTIDIDLEKKERWYTINGKKIPEINILWDVKGLSPETASSLDTREQILLLKDYLHGQKTINSIKNHQDDSIALAKGDYDIAVFNIFAEHPDYESSCQASLRFACRIIKTKLYCAGKTFNKDDILTELTGKLDSADFKEIEEIIPWIQKSPEESSMDSKTTLEDAINAVRSSIALYAKLFNKKDEKKNSGFINISS